MEKGVLLGGDMISLGFFVATRNLTQPVGMPELSSEMFRRAHLNLGTASLHLGDL